MISLKRATAVFLGSLALALFGLVRPIVAQDHPFLLVRSDSFEELRGRASASPWKEMKAAAIEDARALTYDEAAGDVEEKALLLRDILSAATLAYILDPENSDEYVERCRAALFALDDLHSSRGDYWDWKSHVPVANAALHAILALDVLHAEISPQDREQIEGMVDSIVASLNTDSWKLSVWAAKGSWALYRKDRDEIDLFKARYREEMDALLTSSGLFTGGTGYATSRFTKHAREQKFVFMDVLEHTGEDVWYDDPRLKTLYEWMFAHVYAPHASIYIFGDAKLGTSARRRLNQTPATYRAHRFSEKAGRYAAWHVSGQLPPGRFTIYVLADRIMEPERPEESTIYPDGGAWFVHFPDDESFMSAALWNARSSSGHGHKEVNALNLAAFGEFVLVNVGYSNWGNGSLGFSWPYINNWAVSSNTVLIDHVDHASKSGGGIEEGFIDEHLSYASGHSGPALPNGSHTRSLVFVPPADDAAGYWVLFDEIEDAPPGAQFSVALHPYSPDPPVAVEGLDYDWTVRRWSNDPVHLNIFLATPPAFAQIVDGVQADKDRSIRTHYLYSTYSADDRGRGRAATVLVPYNDRHPKPAMSRLDGSSTAASRVSLSEAMYDVVAESMGDDEAGVDGAAFRAKALHFRVRDGNVEAYFARHATHFSRDGIGFLSEHPMSLFLRNGRGKMIASGGEITFYQEGLTAVELDGEPVSPLESGEGWMKVFAEAGSHDVLLRIAEGSNSKSRAVVPTDFVVREIYPQPVRNRATLVFDVPATARLDVRLFDMLGRQVFVNPPVYVDAGHRSTVSLRDVDLAAGTYLYRISAHSTRGTWTKGGTLVIAK